MILCSVLLLTHFTSPMNEARMNKTSFKRMIIFTLLILVAGLFSNCNEELSGPETPIEPPTTQMLNIPAPNTMENLYSPILKVGWKGISKNSIVKGFWVSWESQYLFRNESIIQEPYFTEEATQTIPFPSADSINKQILFVRAEDQDGNVDPIGASVEFFTSKTTPPETEIEFPHNNSSAFIMDEATLTWSGVKIFCTATTSFGVVKDYSLRIDGGDWSPWQADSVFTLTKNGFSGVEAGKHQIEIISRNSALVEDKTPAEITITLVKPSHESEWLIIDDTKDQSGSTERPSDEQVDQFYEMLLADVQHDSWDLNNDGMISKELLGKYKNVLWHCDDKGQSTLPKAAGLVTDYLKTRGQFVLSGWNYMSYFDPEGDWADSTKYFGDILRDYLHINASRTIDDALLDSVYVVSSEYLLSAVPLNREKIWGFRDGFYKVIDFTDVSAFTQPLCVYHSADTVGNDFNYSLIGMGYNNSEYKLVVNGFPFYYLTDEAAKAVFLRSKEYLESDFLF